MKRKDAPSLFDGTSPAAPQLPLFGYPLPAMDHERLVAFRKRLKEQEAARLLATPDETTPSPVGRTPRAGDLARRD